jgi:hypothetical protein
MFPRLLNEIHLLLLICTETIHTIRKSRLQESYIDQTFPIYRLIHIDFSGGSGWSACDL